MLPLNRALAGHVGQPIPGRMLSGRSQAPRHCRASQGGLLAGLPRAKEHLYVHGLGAGQGLLVQVKVIYV